MAGNTAPVRNTAGSGGKKKGGCGTFLFVIIIFVVFYNVVLPSIREKREAQKANKETVSQTAGSITFEQDKADIHEALKEYIRPDTRIIYAQYDGIENDARTHEVRGGEGLTEEERLSIARTELASFHVKEELEEALLNMEKEVCVVGRHPGSFFGYSDDLGPSSDSFSNGVLRSMSYSSFWMESFLMSYGTIPSSSYYEDAISGQRYFIYTFNYYPLTRTEISDMKAQIDRAADEVISCIPPRADLWEQCRVVHDELIRRFEYDYDFGDHCHDLYGAFVERRPVCEGYALAFRFILERLGVNCDIVGSIWDGKPDSTTHAWNCVYGPTEDRYIDVTWDDPDCLDHNGEPIILYDFFGLNEEEIQTVDSHNFRTFVTGTSENAVPFNYYRHEGLMLDSFSEAETVELLRQQYLAGSNHLTVRFADAETYAQASSVLANTAKLDRVMVNMGYYDYYWWNTNDDLHILSVNLGIYPYSENE